MAKLKSEYTVVLVAPLIQHHKVKESGRSFSLSLSFFLSFCLSCLVLSRLVLSCLVLSCQLLFGLVFGSSSPCVWHVGGFVSFCLLFFLAVHLMKKHQSMEIDQLGSLWKCVELR